jgi:hypothetical protein
MSSIGTSFKRPLITARQSTKIVGGVHPTQIGVRPIHWVCDLTQTADAPVVQFGLA